MTWRIPTDDSRTVERKFKVEVISQESRVGGVLRMKGVCQATTNMNKLWRRSSWLAMSNGDSCCLSTDTDSKQTLNMASPSHSDSPPQKRKR